jgi:hypothetical protein
MQCNKSRVSSLVQRLEQEGCVIEFHEWKSQKQLSFTAWVPGVDRWCLLPAGSLAASLQRLFWNQVEFRLDDTSGSIHTKWNYSSRGNFFLHGLASALVALCLVGKVDPGKGTAALLIANGVLAVASYLETWKVRQWANEGCPLPKVERIESVEIEN